MQPARGTLRKVWRRLKWLQAVPAISVLANGARNARAYVLRHDKAGDLPSVIKIDISPQCHLACPHCLHADPAGRDRPLLDAQQFRAKHRMSLEDFSAIISQIAGKTMAVSLFYYGDPLIHPDVDQMIAVARRAGLGVHITTHFSYKFTEQRIRRLVDSGLSHITVAVDGATQESYSQTRVRGQLDLVLKNLEMLTTYKRERGLSSPFVEVQHLRFPHHAPNEAAAVRQRVEAMGIDAFKTSRGQRFDADGQLYNVVDDDAERPGVLVPQPRRYAPRCHWPYSAAVIKSNGEVLPCCVWRAERQYVPGADTRAVGNVFSEDLASIWNGNRYRAIRQQVSGVGGDARSFCEGCPRLYHRASVDKSKAVVRALDEVPDKSPANRQGEKALGLACVQGGRTPSQLA